MPISRDRILTHAVVLLIVFQVTFVIGEHRLAVKFQHKILTSLIWGLNCSLKCLMAWLTFFWVS